VSTRKSCNRAVFEGSDVIALRLRAARKPMVIDLLEIPPEEIDFEPIPLEPVVLLEHDVVPIEPLIVPDSEILPIDDDEAPPPPTAPNPGPVSAAGSDKPKEFPLFGVGWVDVRSKRRGG
jgi:hypothetical protein